MAELQREAHLGTTSGKCANPVGLPCNYLVAPGAPNGTGPDVLQFKLAFSEGMPMGYMTTDFWANYDQIVLQPMYFLVTKWDDLAPMANRLRIDADNPAGPIFSIGPGSAFYSPFWSVFYVVVPPGTVPGKYTSARQLFDDHLEMHQGANRFASIGPDNVGLPQRADIKDLFPDIGNYLNQGEDGLDGVVKASTHPSGWLDGAQVRYVDFGTDNFSADANQVVQDIPLFVFQQRKASGVLDFIGVPNVGGVRPVFTGDQQPVSASNRPRFGGLWRLYIVSLPPTAQELTEDVFTQMYGADPPVGPVPSMYLNKIRRVVLDRACFKMLRAGMDTCVWLDSQQAIEAAIGPTGIIRTGFEPACPFVMFAGAPVPPQ